MAAFLLRGRSIFHSLVIGAIFGLAQVCAFATGSVTLAWMPSADPSVVGYNLYYGGASGSYTNKISAANTTNTIVSGLMEGATYYFAATAYDVNGVESPFSNEASYVVPGTIPTNLPVNTPPTLSALGSLTLNANAGLQTVGLSGISSGAAGEVQTLTVTAASSNPALIPAPAVSYTSPGTTGTLSFAPASNASGTAIITVTVNDGGASNNIVTQTFTVTVNAPVPVPTLNPIANLTLTENAGEQTVNLSGISSGLATGKATIKITAATSGKSLIPAPQIKYSSPNSAGTLTFKPAKNATGTATITVTVSNGQAQNNTVIRTFTVTVNPIVTQPPTLNPINDLVIAENAGVQKISLSGISPGSSDTGKTPKLRITAASSNPALFKKATVTYKNSGIGTLTLNPTKNAVGTATIIVTANNGQKANNVVVRSFTVTVLSSATPTVASKLAVQTGLVTVSPPAPAVLSPVAHADGQFALTIAGSAGTNYIVEASADLVNWVPVATNSAPFTFTDTQAGQFKQRFYRSVSAQ